MASFRKMDDSREKPLESFRLGEFEPEDMSDNKPLKLYQLCAKTIISSINLIEFSRNARIPYEVSDNLIDVFRLMGAKTMCTRFLGELDSKFRVRNANFSGFEVKNKELLDFLESHCKTLLRLNITQCGRLNKELLPKLVQSLLKVNDPLKLHRQVTCYEVDQADAEMTPIDIHYRGGQFLWRKTYHQQKLTTMYNNRALGNQPEQQQGSCGAAVDVVMQAADEVNNNGNPNDVTIKVKYFAKPLLTDFELHQAMGLLKDPDFCEQYVNLQPISFVCNGNDVLSKLSNLSGSELYELSDGNENHFSLYPVYPNAYRTGQEELDDVDLDEGLTEGEMALLTNNCSSATQPATATTPVATTSSTLNAVPPLRWVTQYSRQQQCYPAPKRLNNSSMPYRRVNRSSSSAAGAHISRRFDCSSATAGAFLSSASSSATSGQQQAPPSSSQGPAAVQQHHVNFDVPMTESESNQSAAANRRHTGDADEEVEDIINYVLRCGDQEQFIQFLHGYHRRNALRMQDSLSNGILSGAPATSASCPSLDSSLYITSTPGEHSNSRYMAHNVVQPPDVTPSTLSGASSSSSNPPPARSTTSQSHQLRYFPRYRTSQDWPSTSSASTSSPPSPASLFPNSEPLLSLGNNGDCVGIASHSNKARFFPYEVFRVRSPIEKKVRILEIRTWEESSLESLALGKSVIPNTEVLSTNEISELLFHPQLTNLKRLALHDWPEDITLYISNHLDPAIADRMISLDLSYCSFGIGDGRKVAQLRNLKSLILYNAPKVAKALDSICEMRSLLVLDISTSNDHIAHQFKDPNIQLTRIIKSLPNLTALDISGTNLAGLRQDIIVGLESRKENPLDFLGIFHTSIEASARQNIPALRIAGDTLESYILNSCEAYINRVEMLRKCLNELFQLFRYESRQHNLDRSLKILVCALGRHPNDKLVQVAASATLFYIVKSEEAKPFLGRRIKELIVSRLLDAMQQFRYDQTMLRNGCLNLIHFRIPMDVITEYTRLADILLFVVMGEDDFVSRLGIYLLNSLACQVDGQQKTLIGNLGAIEKMLQLIEIRFNRGQCDEVMETAWSTMWNVTDETPINCERFLNNNGMEFFVSCMDKFLDSPELLRNMMGLLGNVSECAHLRYRLMKPDYITRFVQLLESSSDGIEVSYNSAGILAHIASDGAEIWNRHLDEKCSREDMLAKMDEAITRWQVNSKRNINYRSFEPILRLIRVLSISWQAQYWAVWALANLSRVHCSKYCKLLRKDGGIEVLQDFLRAQRPPNFTLPLGVKRLAAITLFHVYLYEYYGDLRGLDKNSSVVDNFTEEATNLSSKAIAHFFFKNEISHLGVEMGAVDAHLWETPEFTSWEPKQEDADWAMLEKLGPVPHGDTDSEDDEMGGIGGRQRRLHRQRERRHEQQAQQVADDEGEDMVD